MITQAQLGANQQNALKGGVKTEVGKQAIRYNAVRHGVLTKVFTDEEANEANQIHHQMMQEYLPQTLAEELLIETMAIAYTRRQRAINAEHEYFMQILNPEIIETKWIVRPLMEEVPVNPIYGKQEAIIIKEGFQAKFTQEQIDIADKTYSRYITTCEKQFYRALHELQRIQAIRNGQKITSMAVDVLSEKDSGDN